jgi:tetratricopeptide (TPR) repeat protein
MQVHQHDMAPVLDKAEAGVLHELGMSAFQRGNIEVALKFISRACAFEEAPALWHRNHAEILDRAGRSESAEAAAQLALERDPNCANAWETLGTIFAQRGSLAESCECYEKAVQIDPTFWQALNNLAVALDRLGRLEEAEVCYKAVLRLTPESPDIQLNFATLLGELGRYQEGLRIVRQVLDGHPNLMRAHAVATEFTRNLRRREPAPRRVERALVVGPSHNGISPRQSGIFSRERLRSITRQ